MKSSIALLLTACISTLGYYHENSMRVISGDTLGLKNESLFGYSTTYQEQNQRLRLIISAPRADHFGKIFQADLNSRSLNEIQITYGALNYTSLGLLGATVSCTNSYCITCAPRYSDRLNEHSYSECYFGRTLTQWYLLPQLDLGQLSHFNARLTSLGWSISSNSTFMIGNPGSNKGGGVVLWNPDSFETLSMPDMIINRKYYPDFGYSVLSGKFLSEQVSYLISTTFGDYGQGKILFYYHQSYLSYAIEHEIADGDVGSNYGASMAAANLGGVLSSLLVGAPTYNIGPGFDMGAVYVYIQKNEMLSFERLLTGTVVGGYFGAALTSVGDMDNDGLDEVAIGAPYEGDGKGAVYVYSGAGLISQRKWFLRLQPAGFRSFGLSLTAMFNRSGNGIQGIAIGAPDSNAVVIFTGIPVITVKLFATFPTFQKRQDKTVFEFITEIKIEYPKNLKNCEANLSVTIELIHPSAQLSDSNAAGNVVFYVPLGAKPVIFKKPIQVSTPIGGFYNQDISYRISASLVDIPVAQIDIESCQVMLSESSVLQIDGTASVADCDGICIPNLKPTFFASLPNPYIAGSTDNETVSLSIRNEGDTAYTSCLVLRVHPVLVLKNPPDCVREKDADVLLCKPRANLDHGETWQTGDIILETSSLTSADENITVEYDIYDQCEKQSNGTRHGRKLFNVKTVSHGISIQGTSNADNIVKIASRDVEIGKRLKHIYKISNSGPTTWVDVISIVQLPKYKYENLVEIYVTVMTETATYNCSIDKECTEAICPIAQLRKNNVVSVYISMFVLPTKLANKIEKQDINLTSTITLAFDTEKKSLSTTSTLHYNCDVVATWIIILAVLFGLLLIAVLIIILYRCGFLKRKNKEAAEKFKSDINNFKRMSALDCEETQDAGDDLFAQSTCS